MTSKALEAAYDVMLGLRDDTSIHSLREIIRAFAENITDEMAEECFGVVVLEYGVNPEWVATPEQIRAAILKGLE